ncbi:MAG: hypothetical protein DMG65_18290 [Candidatus Angelobacter sp. Gp1-AA117]|nr:MAG: hypothetical protein DMG65_18290 [Candidatus Angelobacter sp. Gp1-AA117]
MTALKKRSASVPANGSYKAAPLVTSTSPFPYPPEKIRELVAELETPFDPSLVEWRVMTVANNRGQIMPYADQRAYTDRLNELFTPAGWTRKYTVHTSANFQRSRDKKVVAKVFVTCDLTIHGIGSHSATGEDWTDDDNAGTSAEAQAFKRACSCFGLGRYLYYFGGLWVDLDERQRPRELPQLFGWATPQGWRQGMRPPKREESQTKSDVESEAAGAAVSHEGAQDKRDLIQQIEAMNEPLGKGLYRGLLKNIARVWEPNQIKDKAVLQKVLTSMQSGERGLRRLQVALDKTGPNALRPILNSMKLKSLDHVDNLETLREVVLALEEKADQPPVAATES